MMALNIPNAPGVLESLLQGINTGGGLYSKLMQPILSREELAQKAKQHEDEMALRRAALARSGANADIQRQLLQQQLLSAQHANDPMYAFNQYKTLQDMFGGKASTSGAPSELAGQGMGIFSPEGLSNEQAMGGNAGGGSNFGGIDLELLKKNPALRGFFKHQFGYDPLAETPQEKTQSKINESLTIDEAKAKRKKISNIEETAKALLPYAQNVQTIENILNKKPHLTGPTTKLADVFGLTRDEDIGTLTSAAQNLQAHMAKELSGRGGYGVSKLVEQAKPGIGKSVAFNKGAIKDLKSTMKSAFEQMDADYFKETGQHLPIDFNQFYKEQMGSSIPTQSTNQKRVKYNLMTGRLE